jgi:hypothetical protein
MYDIYVYIYIYMICIHIHTHKQTENQAAAAAADNKNKWLEWERKVSDFHQIMKESKVTEATERMRVYTLAGLVKADKQWVLQQAGYRQKQELYIEEIRQIGQLIAGITHSMETCKFENDGGV